MGSGIEWIHDWIHDEYLPHSWLVMIQVLCSSQAECCFPANTELSENTIWRHVISVYRSETGASLCRIKKINERSIVSGSGFGLAGDYRERRLSSTALQVQRQNTRVYCDIKYHQTAPGGPRAPNSRNIPGQTFPGQLYTPRDNTSGTLIWRNFETIYSKLVPKFYKLDAKQGTN